MPKKAYKFRELVRILMAHDPRFVVATRRGKGSHRMIHHPDVNGQPQSFPIKCHGENTELRKGTLSALIRRFNLPKDLL